MSPERGLNRLAGEFGTKGSFFRHKLLHGTLRERDLQELEPPEDLSPEEIKAILESERYFYQTRKRRKEDLVASMGDALNVIREGGSLPFFSDSSKKDN